MLYWAVREYLRDLETSPLSTTFWQTLLAFSLSLSLCRRFSSTLNTQLQLNLQVFFLSIFILFSLVEPEIERILKNKKYINKPVIFDDEVMIRIESVGHF